MLRISQIKLNINESTDIIPAKIGKLLRIKNFNPLSWKIVKESTDARKKPDIKFIYTVDFESENEAEILKKSAGIKGINITATPDTSYKVPEYKGKADENRPVIVGFGPCGMFAALILAEAGAKPIVLERGRDADRRTKDVEHFWETGELDTVSNVQFGEGGAGTFSDGKLTTGIKDIRISKVNSEFIEAGADPSIAYSSMPHIGTDVLRVVVKNIREKIISLGGEVRFEAHVTGIETENMLKALIINDSERMECSSAVFAVGNSSRDTFRMLNKAGVRMEPKPFSVGVRIEHPQIMINESQYGIGTNDTEGRLGAAAYKLSHHCENGCGVYTFCMCPGGMVVGSSSEEGGVVTNGMSYFARDGKNANSAVLVDVRPEDCGADETSPLAGIDFQEDLERKAYKLGGGDYIAPAQTLGDFMNGSCEHEFSAVKPTYRPGVRIADLTECLPEFVVSAMHEAIPHMAAKLKGFDMDEAVMTGVETRSSSPVRILRDRDTLQSVSIQGIYPGGEGAGYAGGIMSAAADGIKIAEKLLSINTAACDS
jgi:uncharacterized FAD-dependent dehydrogenase